MSDLVQHWPEEMQRDLSEISARDSWFLILVLTVALIGAALAATLIA